MESPIAEQDTEALTYLEALYTTNLELEKEVVRCREYHEGEQNVKLTERLKQFLGEEFGSFEFRLNVCRIIITAVTEKLSLLGFDSKDPKAISFAKNTWEANNMDAVQTEVYEATLRDSEHFVIVDWPEPETRKYARWLPQPRWTSLEVEGGEGYGCLIQYPNNDVNEDPMFAVKQWSELNPESTSVPIQRRTVYYPNRIEKFRREGSYGEWTRYSDPGDAAWPLPWIDAQGNALGVPVIHFRNKDMQFEAENGIPIQDAINKSTVDLLTTSDQTAFRIYKALGFIPTSDGQDLKADMTNALEIEPGVVVGTTKSKQEADFAAIDPPSLDPLMNLVQQGIMWLALVTDTPVSRFITTKLIASDETLKEQEEPLIAKTENRQALFGPAWKKCLIMSWKLAQLSTAKIEDVPTAEPIYRLVWKNAKGTKELLSELESKQKLRVPDEQIWTELGYGQDKITEWTAAAEKKLADEQAMAEAKANAVAGTLKAKASTNTDKTVSNNSGKETSNGTTA
jgi:hypothetical protein